MNLLDEDVFGVLRPETRTPHNYQIIGFDSEDDTKGVPICFTFHDGQSSFYTKDPRKAMKYILEYPRPAIFCAHNLEYDIGNLMKFCGFKWVDRMIYASRLLRVSLKFSKNYFVNSASFFPGSVKQMGIVVGLPKLDGDPFSREYAERDAQIVQRYMEKLQQKLLKDYGAALGVSIGQISMEVYRRSFMVEPQVTWCAPEALAAYYGGRVEMYYKGILEGPIKVDDFNSCYPYVMRHRDYPDTGSLEKSGLDKDDFGIGKFTVRVPNTLFVPPLPFRNPESKRLFFPNGIMTGWWTFHEIRKAEELGCKVLREWQAVGTSHAVKPFDGFVDHFYAKKEKAASDLEINPKDENAMFEKTYNKLVMNNLYGKLAQHKPSQVLTRTPMPQKLLDRHPDVKVSRMEPFYAYTLARKKAPATANYLWGIYVTAYARLHLLDHLIAVAETPGCQLVYTDTDSVMYTGTCPKIKHGNALGEMSSEMYDKGIFRASKGYLLLNKQEDGSYLVDKVACKGVPTAYALEFVTKGMASVLKPQRLKEALIQLQAAKAPIDKKHTVKAKPATLSKEERLEREIGINVWDRVRKEMRSVYIKRKGSVGVTYPISVDDIDAAERSAINATETQELDMPDDMRLVSKVKPSTAFLDIQIPKGWFDEDPLERGNYKELESVQAHYLSAIECEAIMPSEVWVSGTIIGIVTTKRGDLYKLNVRQYLEQEMDSGAMVALLRPRYLYQEECDEELIGSSLDIILKEEYIKGKSLKLRVEITAGENGLLVDD